MKEISALLENNITKNEIVTSQVSFITGYRKLKMERTGSGHESFEYLLLSFIDPGDYRYLLIEAGWFNLSTALKGVKKKIVLKILDVITIPASYLVEDVLNGIINTNIIHDEIQINRARGQCVRCIISLYEDGVIKLDI